MKKRSPGPLSPSQTRAKENLKDALDRLRDWDGAAPEKIEQDRETFDLCLADYEKAMIRAIRVGLTDHPAVKEWIAVHCALGDRKALRRAQSGVEKGVKRPMTRVNLWLANESRPLRDQGKEPEAIRRTLINELGDANFWDLPVKDARKLRDRLKGMSRQGFHKLLASLDR